MLGKGAIFIILTILFLTARNHCLFLHTSLYFFIDIYLDNNKKTNKLQYIVSI